jgi:DNA repair exonuclease SbcCD nuclease subunit
VSVAATDDLRKDVIVVEDGDGRPGLAVAAIPFMFDAELSNFGRGKVPEDAPRDERVRAGWDKHVRDVIAAAKAAVPGVPVVATGHCVLLDARISDAESERCRRVGGIEAYDPAPYAGADYVALGHLHVPQAAKGFPTRIFYSGSPLRMSFDEGDCPKSINIVTFAAPGEEPTVKTREVPETVPLVTLRGAPEDVKQKLSELVASDRTKRRFVRLQLEGFEGDAQVHWTATRAIAKDTATLVLEECDIRPMSRETVGLRAFAGRDIHHIEPRAVAEQKLKSSNRHFGEEQIAGLMDKFDEAAEEAMA